MGGAVGTRNQGLVLDYSDNEDVTVAERLRQEIELDSSRLDVVTGYLTPSVWGIVGHSLEKVGRFRLLLGKDFELESKSTRREIEFEIQQLVRAALTADLQAAPLPTPEEAADTAGWLKFLARPDDEVDVRVWPEGFLHAKAYILDSSAGVGSANFTAGGLLRNHELVSWRQDRPVVAALRTWFERHWEKALPYRQTLVEILSSSRFGTHKWTPFQVLIRVLYERYGLEDREPLGSERLALYWYQEDAIWRLLRLLYGPANAAILADAVGLGKTRMALGIIHHVVYASTRPKRSPRCPVLLIVPASLREMWEDELDRFGLRWACDLITLQSLGEDLDTSDLSKHDLVVIDEAHRLRGGGTWFRKAMEIVTGGIPEKLVLVLTATPVHTSITDLTNLLRVITKNRRNVWAPEIADFERYLKMVEGGRAEAFPVLDRSIVRRSRTDLVQAYQERRAAGLSDPPFRLPKRRLAHVTYAYTRDGSDDIFERFADLLGRLEVAPYDLKRYRTQEALAVEESETPAASSLDGLYVAGILKRFESSLRAVRLSLERLGRVLARAAEALAQDPPMCLPLGSPDMERIVRAEGDDDTDGADLDALWDRVLALAEPLEDPSSYDLHAVARSIERDQEGVRRLLDLLPPERDDGKVARLRELLTGQLSRQKVLVFSQFRDTARYLYERLARDPAVGRVVEIDGSTPAAQRHPIARWFDPDALPEEQWTRGEQEPMVLVSTDVLAEGHNLQRASAVVNFDLHWNPQVIVQRGGRIDRLNSPYAEIGIYSFLPAEGLEAHLGLVRRLDMRFHLIHFLGLGDEPITRLSGDIQGTTFDQLQRIYRDDETVLDMFDRAFILGSTDYMRQPLEAFLRQAGEEAIRDIPVGVQSVKRLPKGWPYGEGTFIAFRYGPPGTGETHWRFYPDGGGPPLQNEEHLFRAILCHSTEPRVELEDEPWPLLDWALLRRAAADVAEAINRRRATASVLRGASERSRRVREQLVLASDELSYESEELGQLLDRLEDVRIEDVDYRPEFRRFQELLRQARSPDAKDRRGTLEKAVRLGLELLGPPEAVCADDTAIRPEDLTLVAWERLTEPGDDASAAQLGLF